MIKIIKESKKGVIVTHDGCVGARLIQTVKGKPIWFIEVGSPYREISIDMAIECLIALSTPRPYALILEE